MVSPHSPFQILEAGDTSDVLRPAGLACRKTAVLGSASCPGGNQSTAPAPGSQPDPAPRSAGLDFPGSEVRRSLTPQFPRAYASPLGGLLTHQASLRDSHSGLWMVLSPQGEAADCMQEAVRPETLGEAAGQGHKGALFPSHAPVRGFRGGRGRGPAPGCRRARGRGAGTGRCGPGAGLGAQLWR